MSARQSLYGYAMKGKDHSPDNSERMSQEIDAFKAEALREAAERIRLRGSAHLAFGRAAWPFNEAADLIDPDKENSANGDTHIHP